MKGILNLSKSVLMVILINFAVMAGIYIFIFILSLFGIQFNTKHIGSLFLFSAIIGFSGAFISLFMSKFMVKRMYDLKYINDPNNYLYKIVKELANKADIPMPELAIYQGEANAFATGYSKNTALIAISDQLINNLTEEELKGVIAHEIGHIKNGDMITMTLLEGVLNTFVYFLANIISRIINEESKGIFYLITNLALQIVFGIFASIIAMAFSRYREYKADETSAYLNGKEGITKALLKLSRIGQPLPQQLKAFGIIGFNIGSLFLSHPPIEKRIKHIENLKFN